MLDDVVLVKKPFFQTLNFWHFFHDGSISSIWNRGKAANDPILS